MNDRHARLLFGSGALFNFVVGSSFLLASRLVGSLAGMEPPPAGDIFERLAGFAIVLFGWMYWMVSRDPVTYRPFILAGIVGKLGVVAIAFTGLAAGITNLPLPLLTLVDLAYVVLFWRYLVVTQ